MGDNAYLGNPLLKPAGVPHDYTEEELSEYIKCSKKPQYFIENYIKVIHVDEGLIPFKLYKFQKEMVKTIHDNRFSIFCTPRQVGKSTTVVAYFLWYILFNESVNIAILANKGSLARDILGRLQLAYENLPDFLQQGVLIWNKGNLEIENGSKVVAASTSSSAIRGGSYNMILLDEFAFVPPNIADEFMSSVYPTISSGTSTKIVVVSTPNGLNHFYKMWEDAKEKRNNYVPLSVHWTDVPGRDNLWKTETIRNIGKERWAQEFEGEFVGGLNTLISGSTLKNMVFKNPAEKNKGLDIYEPPKEDHLYMITVDVSLGEDLDYSAFSVIDATDVPYRQVAKYRNASITPLIYPNVIASVAEKYNQAYVLVEINGIGKQVSDILHNEVEYENLVMISTRGRAGQVFDSGFGKGTTDLGLTMSKKVKQIGCSMLKSLIEENKLIVNDFDTISELCSFVAKAGSYEADVGCHDDLVMSLLLFAWLTSQPHFKDITDLDLRKQLLEEKMRLLEDDILPFGFVDAGMNGSDESFVDADGQVWFTVPT
ncbi:MAG TPA: terminase [Flavobacteriales bacterium]|nr:terminase [Flavobacteriales bacterium]